jgi:hypothetical protein
MTYISEQREYDIDIVAPRPWVDIVAQFSLSEFSMKKLPNSNQGIGEPKFGLPMMDRHVKSVGRLVCKNWLLI